MDYEADMACPGEAIEVGDLVLINLVEYRIVALGDDTRQTRTFQAQNLRTGAYEYPVVRFDDSYDLLTEV